jgi:hypothetical protein
MDADLKPILRLYGQKTFHQDQPGCDQNRQQLYGAMKQRVLTPKQERFVEEYLTDLNGSAAAVRAGYSKRSPDKIASQLLGKGQVAEAIETAKADRAKQTKINAAWVLDQLRQIAEAKKTDL